MHFDDPEMRDIGQTLPIGVDLREYYLSMEWDLISATAFKGRRSVDKCALNIYSPFTILCHFDVYDILLDFWLFKGLKSLNLISFKWARLQKFKSI